MVLADPCCPAYRSIPGTLAIEAMTLPMEYGERFLPTTETPDGAPLGAKRTKRDWSDIILPCGAPQSSLIEGI